jgi:hypothetical protein
MVLPIANHSRRGDLRGSLPVAHLEPFSFQINTRANVRPRGKRAPGISLGVRLDSYRRSEQRNSARDDYCLVFLHIPKTAGTTLASALQWNYPPYRTLHIDLLGRPLEELEAVPVEERSRLSLLHGHFAYGIHRYVPRPCRYVTVLREPIPRVISAYKHVLRRPQHELHGQVVGDGISLEEFIETFWVDKRISRQTRQLCNRHDGPLDRGALEEAKRNLEGFLLVGLTERFEETFALLRRAVRLRLPFYVTRNVGQTMHASKHAVELIREREQLDLELYDFARDLFAQQVGRQSSSFTLEASIYRGMRPLSRAAGAGTTQEFLRKLSHARVAWHRAGDPLP